MFTIVNKRFTPGEFRAYVESISLSEWKPKCVVIHNTASPSLAQRPNGFTVQQMKNLQAYYSGKGWNGGPHCFVDDKGIWVFNPLDKRGTHSPSWNGESWGIELLGDFSTESPTEGRGEKVVENGAAAAVILLRRLGLTPRGAYVRFHFEDPQTDHACPGKLLTKDIFTDAMDRYRPKPTGWSVLAPDGSEIAEDVPTGANGSALVRAVWEASGGTVQADSDGRVIRLVKGE